MTVCYFGLYNRKYIRNKVLISGLEKNGVKILECQDNSSGLLKYWRLFKKHRAIKGKYDILIVGFSGQLVLPLAKLLSDKKVILDAMVPLHDAMVYNHKKIKKISLESLFYWLLDYISLYMSDLVLTDTLEHIKFYHDKFGIKKDKCLRIFVGADDSIFYPRKSNKKSDKFIVEFHGIVFGEHGIDYILEAARILETEDSCIFFNIIGASKQYDEAKNKALAWGLKNIDFIGRKPVEEIPQILAEADVCLGLFGATYKAQRVIPAKGFEIIASARPYINSDGAGMRELFTSGVNCLLCQPADGRSLAEAILRLKNDAELRDKIAHGGYELFKSKTTPQILGATLKNKLETLL